MVYLLGLLFWLSVISGCTISQAKNEWKPNVYSAIKWTAPQQGVSTIAFARANRISHVPIAYHGGVDTNASGDYTSRDFERFSAWSNNALPPEYCGPVVLDYEHPWWGELRAKTISKDRLQEILSVYTTGVRAAREYQSNALWGYYGLPALRHTSEQWNEQGLSLNPLFVHCKALYPEIYDCSPGKDLTARVEFHITKALEIAAGKIPVFVFVTPRYCGQHSDKPSFIPDDAFSRQVNAALRATWTDANGKQHKISGVIFWDAYSLSPATAWEELDKKHKHYLELLVALRSAWNTPPTGENYNNVVSIVPACTDALPMPHTSGLAVLEHTVQKQIPSTRVDGNRVDNKKLPQRSPQ